MHMHPSNPEFQSQGAEFFLLCPFKPATDTGPANPRDDGVIQLSCVKQNKAEEVTVTTIMTKSAGNWLLLTGCVQQHRIIL